MVVLDADVVMLPGKAPQCVVMSPIRAAPGIMPPENILGQNTLTIKYPQLLRFDLDESLRRNGYCRYERCGCVARRPKEDSDLHG